VTRKWAIGAVFFCVCGGGGGGGGGIVCCKLILMGNMWHCRCVSNGKTTDEWLTMLLFWSSYDL
jgi:hypothetical protein